MFLKYLVLFIEYVKSLESEIRGLRSKNRSLTQQVEKLAEAVKPPITADVVKGKMADPFIQTHIKELNDTIGWLIKVIYSLSIVLAFLLKPKCFVKGLNYIKLTLEKVSFSLCPLHS